MLMKSEEAIWAAYEELLRIREARSYLDSNLMKDHKQYRPNITGVDPVDAQIAFAEWVLMPDVEES